MPSLSFTNNISLYRVYTATWSRASAAPALQNCPCKRDQSGAVPGQGIWSRARFVPTFKACWLGSALARHQFSGSVNAKQRWSRAVLCSSMRILVSATTCVHHWSAKARVNHKIASWTEERISSISYDAQGSQQDDV